MTIEGLSVKIFFYMNDLLLKAFVNKKPIGLVLRAYSLSHEMVEQRIQMILETVQKAQELVVNNVPIFSRIDVMVWSDKRYDKLIASELIYTKLKNTLKKYSTISVHNVLYGDVYCGILNAALARQLEHGMKYSLVLSSDARSYLDLETMRNVITAAHKGAKAVGVALHEIKDSVLDGRLACSFCLWDTEALVQVGGFDLQAAMPYDEKMAPLVRGWMQEQGQDRWIFYPLCGVEEIFPLVRLVDTFGPCLAPILPSQKTDHQGYEVPDKNTFPEIYKRHVAKMLTKRIRQDQFLSRMCVDGSYLQGGIMPHYRQS